MKKQSDGDAYKALRELSFDGGKVIKLGEIFANTGFVDDRTLRRLLKNAHIIPVATIKPS